ncbi:MAG: arginine repressor [Pyrinomonadaceae bacterium]
MYIMRGWMDKHARQQLLLDIVSAKPINRQDQLVRLLRKNGHAVTQASVSRDLEELGISKVLGTYRTHDSNGKGNAFGVVRFDTSGDNLIVARCGSGLASAFAVRLDAAMIDGIVGTIAGDDTVFIAVADKTVQHKIIPKLIELFDGT